MFWATIGGIAVFIGLLLEKFAEWMDEKFLGGTYKPHKTLESIGWSILMLGIFVEIAVAGWSANDVWQTRQMAIKNDPLNQPIGSATARVFIVENGTNTTPYDDLKKFPVDFAYMVRLQLFNSKEPTKGVLLFCTSFNRFTNDNGGFEWVMQYDREMSPHRWMFFEPLPDVRSAIKCDQVVLSAPFIPRDTEILRGSVAITINEQRLIFDIPGQRVGMPLQSTNLVFPVKVTFW